MDRLSAIVGGDSIQVPEFGLDRFQAEVLRNLHLEFFLEKCRVLITPHLRYSTTGEATREEADRLNALLAEKQEQIQQLKRYLLFNLSLYSGLLEANSYDIAINHHLLISRFVDFKAHPGVYEIKLYTLSQDDLIAHYGDKIYLGRDFVSLERLQRDHFGIAWIRDSLRQQLGRLASRVVRLAGPVERSWLEEELLPELEESLDEFGEEVEALMAECPPRVSAEDGSEVLLEVNSRFREVKHTLSEAESTLREAEARLIAASSDVARYVTKLRKDLTNDVDYVMVKINGRISDALNGIHLL
jgi:hypothetical protein